MVFNKILVAVDGGAPATRAAIAACALAKELNSEVRLYHAVELTTAAAQSAMSPADATKFAEQESQEIFAGLLGLTSSAPAPQGRWGLGDPVNRILQAAADWPADLLVIGSHGRDGMIRMMMGSVAEKVTRQAPCPVLVVKATEAASEAKRRSNQARRNL